MLPEPIQVPELEDTLTPLAQAERMWDAIPNPAPPIPPIIDADTQARIAQLVLYPEKPFDEFDTVCQEWRALEYTYRVGAGLEAESAGETRYQALQNIKRLAKYCFTCETLISLVEHSETHLARLTEATEALKANLLAIASQGPADPNALNNWEIDLAAAKRAPITFEQLIALYFKADRNLYVDETGLAPEVIDTLHNTLATYLALSTQRQQLQRILTSARSASKDDALALFRLGETLFAENLVDPILEPALTVFQYHEDKLLRPQQYQALGRLLTKTSDGGYEERIEKITMGGGKSKIVLPALAKEKASGDNLVIIEVPASMLRTNFTDLKSTSGRLFGQTAHEFKFSRNSPSSAQDLERLYLHLTSVMVNKEYLVTTADSLQSVELKCVEILLSRPPGDDTPDNTALVAWKERLKWAERLCLLFRNRGDLIIDEVHLGLAIKLKLIYSYGHAGQVPEFIITHSVGLYQFLKQINVNIGDGEPFNLAAVINNHRRMQGLTYETELATALVREANSPLRSVLNPLELTGAETEACIAYLQDNTTTVPTFMRRIPPSAQMVIVFYKEQITEVLRSTLSREYSVDYGPYVPSEEEPLPTDNTPEKRAISRPYRGKDKPIDGNQHGNALERVNLTIQAMLNSGVPEELLIPFLDNIQLQGRVERRNGDFTSVDETPSGLLFESLFPDAGFKLSQLDINDAGMVQHLSEHISGNEMFIYEVLQREVLPAIPADTDTLPSDVFNRVDMVRSCQGISGTPVNNMTYHPRLTFDDSLTQGDDAFILHNMIAKEPQLQVADYTDLMPYLSQIFSSYTPTDRVRTLIEASAVFKNCKDETAPQGISYGSNETVARGIAKFIQDNPHHFYGADAGVTPVKFVLFFNEQDQLSAIPVDATYSTKAIVIGSSDPDVIEARLGCGADERFTFYDQLHTVGADIKQGTHSKALVTVASDLIRSRYNQSASRMRELLEGEQQFDIIVTSELQEETLEPLVEKMARKEDADLSEDYFTTCLGLMQNAIRNDLLQRIFAISGENAADRKHAFMQRCQTYFKEITPADFIKKHAGINQHCHTLDIFTAFEKRLFEHWRALLNAQDEISISHKDEASIQQKLAGIRSKYAKPGVCAEQHRYRDNGCGNCVEIQQDMNVERDIALDLALMKQKQQQASTYHPDAEREGFEYTVIHSTESTPFWTTQHALRSLNDLCSTLSATDRPVFNANIQASKNFYLTHKVEGGDETGQLINPFSKAVHGLFFSRVNGVLTCVILSQEELHQITGRYAFSDPLQTLWITTTQHQVLEGTPPPGIRQNEDYNTIIEQVRYFNGELGLILEDHIQWLTEDAQLKLRFYQQYLMPIRQASVAEYQALRETLSGNTQVYDYIAQHPHINFDDFGWQQLHPECKEEDVTGYQNLARAFKALNERWWDAVLTPQEICREHNVPLKALGYIRPYIQKLDFACRVIQCAEDYPIVISQLREDEQQEAQDYYQLAEGTPASQSFELLMSLLYDLSPMLVSPAVVILRALAQNPCLNDPSSRFEESTNLQDTFATILSEDSGVDVDGELLNTLLKLPLDDVNLLTIAQHPQLASDDIPLVLEKATQLGTQLHIASILVLTQADIDIQLLYPIIQDMELSAAHIDAILRLDIDLEIFNWLVRKSPRYYPAAAFIQSEFFDSLSEDKLLILVERSTAEDTALACLNHAQLTPEMLGHFREHGPFTDNILAKFIELSDIPLSDEIIEEVLSKDSVGDVTLAAIAERTDDEALLERVCDQRLALNSEGQRTVEALLRKEALPSVRIEACVGLILPSGDPLFDLALNHRNVTNPIRRAVLARQPENAAILTRVWENIGDLDNTELKEQFFAAFAPLTNLSDDIATAIFDQTRALPTLNALKAQARFQDTLDFDANDLLSLKAEFDHIMAEFRITADRLITAGTEAEPNYNAKYQVVGQRATELLASLNTAADTFFDAPVTEVTKTTFTTACHDALHAAHDDFKVHRGGWKHFFESLGMGILGILATVTVLPAIVVACTTGYSQTFFARQTSSNHALDKFEQAFDQAVAESNVAVVP